MDEIETEEHGIIRTNRLLAVFAGTTLWISVLSYLLPAFNTGYALVLAGWIAIGSKDYSRTLSDFQRPMKLRVPIGLALLAPGWPFLYRRFKRGA